MLLWTFARFSLRRLVQGWTFTLLISGVVALGVAVFLAVLFASEQSLASFAEALPTLTGETELRIISDSGEFDPKVLSPLLRSVADDFLISALLQYEAELQLPDGRGVPLVVNGIQGIERLAGGNPQQLSRLVATPALINDLALQPGTLIKLVIEGKQIELHLAEVAKGPSALLFSSAAFLDLSTLLTLTSNQHDPKVSAVLLQPREPIGSHDSLTLLQSAVRKDFPTLHLEDNSAAVSRGQRLLGAFRLNIGVLVLMAMLVSALVIFNSFQIRFAALRTQLATLRTIGFTPRQLFGLVLGEALACGLLGSIIGMVIARPLTQLLAERFLRTAAELYTPAMFAAKLPSFTQAPHLFIYAGLAGVLVALSGALLPALSVSKEAPGLSARTRISTTAPRLKQRLRFGLMLLGLGGGCCYLALQLKSAAFAHLCSLAILSCLLINSVPALAATVFAIKRLVGRRLSPSALFSLSEVLASLRTFSVSVAATGCGLTLLIALGIMIASFRDTLHQWIDYSVRADLFVQSNTLGTPVKRPVLPERFVNAVMALPEVRKAARFSSVDTTIRAIAVQVAGADLDLPAGGREFKILSGNFDREALLAGTALLISESGAAKLALKPGDTVSVAGRTFALAGIYKEFSTERGTLLMHFPIYSALFDSQTVQTLSIYLHPTVSISEVRSKLGALPQAHRVQLLTNRDLRDKINAIFDRTFSVTQLLRIIVMLIAGLGFSAAILQLFMERGREFRTLHILGMSVGALRWSTLLEGLILALPSAILGILFGLLLAFNLIFVINPISFGWTLQFVLRAGDLLMPVAVVSIGSIVMSALPSIWLRSAALRASLSEE
ncbi:MAG: FtsX-like permease family protein [Oligoflexia bacterium]|nr:FtsX-like permease family protein [Oligoflexia bacterium]